MASRNCVIPEELNRLAAEQVCQEVTNAKSYLCASSDDDDKSESARRKDSTIEEENRYSYCSDRLTH